MQREPIYPFWSNASNNLGVEVQEGSEFSNFKSNEEVKHEDRDKKIREVSVSESHLQLFSRGSSRKVPEGRANRKISSWGKAGSTNWKEKVGLGNIRWWVQKWTQWRPWRWLIHGHPERLRDKSIESEWGNKCWKRSGNRVSFEAYQRNSQTWKSVLRL